jgi:threonine/homoserine/homoserine lactone efflux protein
LFLVQAAVISLSGVMAPGPVTAATIAAGVRWRHSGALIAIGHGLLEFPLMFLILAGIGKILESNRVQIAIGLTGGFVLCWMAVGLFRTSPHLNGETAVSDMQNPVWTGFILSATNPYFFIWWATVGLALAKNAIILGIPAFVMFTIVHWVCDLIWLEVLSFTSHKGSQLLSQRNQRIILAGCSVVMLLFGLIFVYNAVMQLHR